MASLPESWKLETKPRPDGKVDIVGKNDIGQEYVARTTEEPGVTEKDLKMLALGNRETSSAKELVNFYKQDRERVNEERANAMTDDYMDAAEQVVRAGLHLSESRVGYSRLYAQKWESVFGES